MNTNYITFKTVAFAVCLLTTTFAMAQPHPEKMVERLAEDLNLNDEQTNAILKIHEEAASQCEAAESKESHHECMKSKRDDVDSAIKGVLTEEQQTKFEEIKANHPRHKGERPRD